MSGIYGIIHTDGKPLEPSWLEQMAEALLPYGPDRQNSWQAGPIGFGHLLAFNTPESLAEQQPYYQEGVLVSSDLRLDNRLELFDLLGVPHPERPAVTDDRLLLLAYQRWGPTEQFVTKLLGAFAFAIWDSKRLSLFLARDHAGFRPLFYYHGSGFLAFASDVRALIALPDVPRRLDERYFLAQDLKDYQYVLTHNPYLDICKLESGTCLTFCDDRLDLRTFWHAGEVAELRLKNLDAYAEVLTHLLEQAVQARLRSAFPLGSHLSGGLDSSVVTVLSKRILDNEGRRLQGVFSWSPSQEEVPAGLEDDERVYIQPIMDQEDLQVIHRQLSVEGAADSYERDLLHEPLRETTEESFICQEAAQLGIRTLLSGWGGDELISYRGWGYLAQLFLDGRWRKLIKEARSSAQEKGINLPRTLLDSVVKSLFPGFVDTLRGRGVPHGLRTSLASNDLSWEDLFPSERQMITQVYRDKAAPITIRSRQVRMWRSGLLRFRLEAWGHLGRRWGVEYRYPLLDRRIVDFALSLPPDVLVKDGKARYLMRYAMRDTLPEQVIWRTQKLEMARRSLVFQVTQAGLEAYLRRHFGRTPRGNPYLNYRLRLVRIVNGLLTLDGEPIEGTTWSQRIPTMTKREK